MLVASKSSGDEHEGLLRIRGWLLDESPHPLSSIYCLFTYVDTWLYLKFRLALYRCLSSGIWFSVSGLSRLYLARSARIGDLTRRPSSTIRALQEDIRTLTSRVNVPSPSHTILSKIGELTG